MHTARFASFGCDSYSRWQQLTSDSMCVYFLFPIFQRISFNFYSVSLERNLNAGDDALFFIEFTRQISNGKKILLSLTMK